MDHKNHNISFHVDVSDFIPADENEKSSLTAMRESVSFWKDGFRRLRKNKLAMASLIVIVIVLVLAFIVPSFYPYSYEQQIRGSENLSPLEYSQSELDSRAVGESVFPHFLGTDSLGRDTMIRIMMGSRISLLVGIVASTIILLIGSVYGSISGYFGGKVDMVMMRIVDIIYTIPDILIIILLSVTLKYPLKSLAANVPGFGWINTVGVGLISIFIVFSPALLGRHGTHSPRTDSIAQRTGICHRRACFGSITRQDYPKASFNELYRYAHRHHNTANSRIHIYRKLS